MASRVIRKVRDMLDVDDAAIGNGKTLVFRTASGKHEYEAAGGGGAPTTADYLVGTAQAGLSAEIVAGATPGGELGGTWASPTVDATHSGSSHAAVQAAAEASSVILAPAASARNVIQPTLGSVIAAVVRAHAAQSVDLTQWQTSAAAVLAKIGSTGCWTIQPSALGLTGAVLIDAGTPPLVGPNEPQRATLNLKATPSLATDGIVYGVRFGSYQDSNFDHANLGRYDWLFDYSEDAGDTYPYLTMYSRRASDRKAMVMTSLNPGFILGATYPAADEVTVGLWRLGGEFGGDGKAGGLKLWDLNDFLIHESVAGGVATFAFQRVAGTWKFGVFGSAPAPVVQQSASSVGALWTALEAYGWLAAGSSAPDLATQAELDAHINDSADAHDASAISILDTAGDFTATDVEGALAELQTADELGMWASMSPDTLTGLVLWLKGDTPALADAAAVTTWADSSASAFDVTEATNKPTYRTNVLNGHHVVEFDGTNDKLARAGATLTGATGFTYIAVAKFSAAGSYPTIIAWPASNNELRAMDTLGRPEIVTNGGGATAAMPAHLDGWHTFCGRFNNDNGAIDLLVDGNLLASSKTTAGTVAGGDVGIGSRAAGADFLNGQIAEVIAFKRALTERERRGVLRYLNDKYVLPT